jgi:hypothetical protein
MTIFHVLKYDAEAIFNDWFDSDRSLWEDYLPVDMCNDFRRKWWHSDDRYYTLRLLKEFLLEYEGPL